MYVCMCVCARARACCAFPGKLGRVQKLVHFVGMDGKADVRFMSALLCCELRYMKGACLLRSLESACWHA